MTLTQLPGVPERVETGPLQFGDDWPGVFIRGDNALYFAYVLAAALKHIPNDDWLLRASLRGLLEDLQSCHIEKHR